MSSANKTEVGCGVRPGWGEKTRQLTRNIFPPTPKLGVVLRCKSVAQLYFKNLTLRLLKWSTQAWRKPRGRTIKPKSTTKTISGLFATVIATLVISCGIPRLKVSLWSTLNTWVLVKGLLTSLRFWRSNLTLNLDESTKRKCWNSTTRDWLLAVDATQKNILLSSAGMITSTLVRLHWLSMLSGAILV